MMVLNFDELPQGGFAGLRERRFVTDSRAFGTRKDPATAEGIGNFVYLADANFMPHGETGLHPHREIDVISIIVEGRLDHAGSLQHGESLHTGTVQVQRAGGEGFSHNEVNPDDAKNRMIQIWVLPETPGEPAGYQMFEAAENGRTRIYGGPADQDETFPARTIIEIVHMKEGDKLDQPGRCIIYVTSGAGTSLDETLREGDLVETSNFSVKALTDSTLIVVYEQ